MNREILFVFEGQTQQSRRARELETTAIRSHAARFAKRKRRDVPKEHILTPPIQHTAPDPPSPKLPIRRPARLPSISVLLEWQPLSIIGDVEKVNLQAEASTPRTTLLPSPVSMLGQGRIDPFGTCLAASLPAYILKYLEFAYEVVWPALAPLTREAQSTLWWRSVFVNEPHTVDIHVVAAASLAAQLAEDPVVVKDAIRIRRLHRQRSIDWINDEVTNAKGPPPDRIISGAVAIMYHTKERTVYSYQNYRQTPLAEAKSLHIFGGSDVLPEDLKFLCKLVELKGGMECVDSVAVRNALTLVDVIFATRHGSRPAFMLEEGFADLAGPRPICTSYLQSTMLLDQLGTGFSFIQDGPLLQVIQDCCELTVDLAHFQQKIPSSPSFSYISHKTLGVQHALCNLAMNSFTTNPGHHHASNLVQIATLLYSDIVLFAMPPAAGVRVRLLTELRTILEATFEHTLAGERYYVWLWALVVGAVGSIMGDGQSSWFIDVLRQQSSHPLIDCSWPRLKVIVARFLWWEHVMDAPALDAWTWR